MTQKEAAQAWVPSVTRCEPSIGAVGKARANEATVDIERRVLREVPGGWSVDRGGDA